MISGKDANASVPRQQRSPKPPSETENKIFALLKSISGLKAEISEDHCRGYANYLNGVVVLSLMNHHGPQSKRVGAKRTRAELDRLADLGRKIANALAGAHRETNELISAALPDGVSLSQYKRVMREAIEILCQADLESGKLTAKGEKPSDEFAVAVTRAAAETFSVLTGRQATVIVKHVPAGYNGTKAQSSGPFLDFLSALFEALGIEANAEYHARQLRRNRT